MFRVLTLNLNYHVDKHGPWGDRRALIVKAARDHDVDVMVLQAVEGAGDGNQAEELATRLGFRYTAFVAASNERGRKRGSAFVSRQPVEVEMHQLGVVEGHEDPGPRVVLRGQVQTRGMRIDLYNAHFSWVAEQAVQNVRDTLSFRRPGPALLLGDLNSPPDSPAVTLLRESGWCDLWAERRSDETGHTFESDHPTQRIDYVFASADLRARVHAIDRVGTEGGRPPRFSDHLALLVALQDEAA